MGKAGRVTEMGGNRSGLAMDALFRGLLPHNSAAEYTDKADYSGPEE